MAFLVLDEHILPVHLPKVSALVLAVHHKIGHIDMCIGLQEITKCPQDLCYSLFSHSLGLINLTPLSSARVFGILSIRVLLHVISIIVIRSLISISTTASGGDF